LLSVQGGSPRHLAMVLKVRITAMQRKADRLWVCGLVVGVLAIAAGTSGLAQDPTPKLNPRRGFITDLQRDFDKAGRIDTPFTLPEDAPYNGQFELQLNTGMFDSRNAAKEDPSYPTWFQLLSYNKSRVGPTIRVKRGAKFRIRVKNDLDKHSPDPGENPNDIGVAWEAYHGLCTTNLHTHGLHVSPSGNSDNIFTLIDPGCDFTYEYEINKSHPSGTFWYHPHKHGSVAYQLSNGVSGALIVEGSPDDDILDLDEIPEIAAANKHEKILVLQWYTFIQGTDHVGRIDARSIYNVPPHINPLRACPSIPANFDPNSQQLNALAINGIINPTLKIAPGEVQRWRIIHAGWDVEHELSLVNEKKQPVQGPDLILQEIAVDGLATGTMTARPQLPIAPGQRSDDLIKAPKIPGRYFLMSTSPDANPPIPPMYIATVEVVGNPNEMALPDPSTLANCNPFKGKEIKDDQLCPPTISNGTLEFAGQDPDQTKINQPYFYTINYTTFHKQQMEPIPLTLGTAQEWTITARVSNHPYHIHVNPFYVVSYTTPCNKDQQGNLIPTPVGLWRDTLYVREGQSYTIRSRFQDYPGDSVLHCHILDHEDQGMMMRIRLIDPNQPPIPGKGALGLQDAWKPAPRLKLADAHGRNHELAEFAGRNVVLVFFRGVQCFHCSEQLQDLVREARGNLGDDVEIVAVSSRKIAEPAVALKALGVGVADRFQLLVDESHRTFRDFGCFDGQPQHGLYLIDRDGVIRARYVGESPLNDTKEVIRRIGEIARAGVTALR
jgi:FtsP/CotA-like multicopper oxidase with cupredoxin domain/peroxiredoxin